MSSRAPVTNDGGFWRLDHDGLAAILARRELSWGLVRVYLALADLTLGYGREQDTVSLSQMAERAGMYSVKPDGSKCPDCPHVARAIKELSKRGLYGCARGKGQSVVRWVVWPAPPMPSEATAGVGNPATAGSGTTAELGNETTAKATAEAGRHQDSKNHKTRKKGAASPPAAEAGGFSLRPEEKTNGNGAAGRLIGAWCALHEERIGKGYPKTARGRLAGGIKALLKDYSEAELEAAFKRFFAADQRSFGIGLFTRKLTDGDADVTGRAVSNKGGGRSRFAQAETDTDYDALTEYHNGNG